MYKERKETTHGKIGENDNNIIIYIYIYNGEINTMFAINKWSQDRYTKRIMYLNRKKRREYINPHYIPQKI